METESQAGGKHPFAGIALAAIAGIGVAGFFPLPILPALAITVLSLLLWLIYRRTFTLLTFVAAFFYLLHGLQFDRNPARQLASALAKKEVTVSGTGFVDSVPVENTGSNGKIRSQFQLGAATLKEGEADILRRPISLLVNWPGAGLQIGDQVRFEGTLANLQKPRNPGEFDYASYLARQQIFSHVVIPFARDAHVIARGSSLDLRRLANQSKLKLSEIITRDLGDSPLEAGVISAMMLGAKSDTPDATLEMFMKTGTFHLFSVSGLHVAMLAGIVLFLLTTMRVPRNSALLLTIPAVFSYAFITGWSASGIRAAMMTSAFVVATFRDRPSLSINTLAVTGFILLICNTNQLFSAGFQLSFSVVAAIILFSQPIKRFLRRLTDPDPFIPKKLLTRFQKSRWLVANEAGGTVALTLAAWLGSLPLTAIYFNLFSPVALIANLAIIPLAFSILLFGVLAIMTSLLGSWFVISFNNASWGMVKLLLGTLGIFTALPGGSLFVGSHWWQLPNHERLTFFDLGSGGATVIETSDSCWMIDCGSDGDYRQIVRNYLQQRGINQVDGIFLTHGDGGHVGGLTQFLVDFPKAKVFLPAAGRKSIVFRRLVNKDAVNWISRGAAVTINSGVLINVLWPPPEVDGGRADDHSLVLKLTVSGQTFLLMGDSGLITELDLQDKVAPGEMRADWLSLGRNRDDPGGSPSFLENVGAKTVLCTAANFPSSEKVPQSLVESCYRLNMRLLRFDETGAVQIDLQDRKIDLKAFGGDESDLQ